MHARAYATWNGPDVSVVYESCRERKMEKGMGGGGKIAGLSSLHLGIRLVVCL